MDVSPLTYPPSNEEHAVEDTITQRVVAVLVVVDALFHVCSFLALLALHLGAAWGLVLWALIFDMLVAVVVWRGAYWRSITVVRSLAGVVIYALGSSRDVLAAVTIEFGLAAALVILITGESSRRRRWLAVGLYVVTFVAAIIRSIASS